MSENRAPTFPAGIISSPHGIKGEVKLASYLTEDFDFTEVDEIYLQFRDGSRQTRRLLKVRHGSKGPLLTIEGVNDRNEAEKLRGAELYIDGDFMPEPEEGQYYRQDLVGATVGLKNGEPVGTVKYFVDAGANTLLAIDKGGKELLVPFVEAIIVSVDVKAKSIIIDPPEGLLELADE